MSQKFVGRGPPAHLFKPPLLGVIWNNTTNVRWNQWRKLTIKIEKSINTFNNLRSIEVIGFYLMEKTKKNEANHLNRVDQVWITFGLFLRVRMDGRLSLLRLQSACMSGYLWTTFLWLTELRFFVRDYPISQPLPLVISSSLVVLLI